MSILENDDGMQFHLKIKPGDIAPRVVLCGDPGRVPKIAAYLENPRLIAENREYVTYTGMYKGVEVGVASTGIGGPSAAICAEELYRCGVKTMIRVGTSGGINLDVMPGDLVIASAAVRDDGTSAEYLPAGYPAVADFAVTRALAESAAELCAITPSHSYHVGVVQSKDSFYGETNPEGMPMSTWLEARWEAYVRLGCLASEMECSALYSVAATRRMKAGGVLLAIWNVERSKAGLGGEPYYDTDMAVRCALNAIIRL